MGLDHAEARVLLKGSLPAGWQQRLNVKQATGELHAAVTWTGTMLRATVNPPSTVAFTDFNPGPLRSSVGVFHLEEPLHVDVDLPNKRWSLAQGTWVWRSPRFRAGTFLMTMQRIALKLERTEASIKTYRTELALAADGIVLEHPTGRSMPLDLAVQVAADPELVKADAQIRGRDRPNKLAVHLEHESSTGRGSARGVLDPVVFDATTLRLGQSWTPWPFPGDVTAGSVAGSGHRDGAGGLDRRAAPAASPAARADR